MPPCGSLGTVGLCRAPGPVRKGALRIEARPNDRASGHLVTQQGDEKPGDLALGCADGCVAIAGLLIFVGLGFGALVLVIVLIGGCFQAVFSPALAQEPTDPFIRGMIEAGILPADFVYVPPTPTPAPPERYIEIELTHSRTSFDIDYTRVCVTANFYIPPAHLVMGVIDNEQRSNAIDNYGSEIATSNRDRGCEARWTYLGSTKVGTALSSFDLASSEIDRLRTFDSEALVTTLWHCDRQDDFFKDALFRCGVEASWEVPNLGADSAMLLVHVGEDGTSFKSRVDGLTGFVENFTRDAFPGWYYRIRFTDLPEDQWFDAGGMHGVEGGRKSHVGIVGIVGVEGRWTGLYCMPEDEELVLCDVWSAYP